MLQWRDRMQGWPLSPQTALPQQMPCPTLKDSSGHLHRQRRRERHAFAKHPLPPSLSLFQRATHVTFRPECFREWPVDTPLTTSLTPAAAAAVSAALLRPSQQSVGDVTASVAGTMQSQLADTGTMPSLACQCQRLAGVTGTWLTCMDSVHDVEWFQCCPLVRCHRPWNPQLPFIAGCFARPTRSFS